MIRRMVFAAVTCICIVTTGSATLDSFVADPKLKAAVRSTKLQLVFAGDIMAHDVNYARRPYANIYAHVRETIWDADLSFANLEFVFDPDKPASGYPEFNAPLDYVQAAINGGFNVFSLANNHSYDLGPDSLKKTLSAIEQIASTHKIYYSGISTAPEQFLQPTYFEESGIRVGFLAVTSFLNRLSLDRHVNVVPFYDHDAEDRLLELIEEYSRDADLFIISYHGGEEYRVDPSEKKKQLFHSMIDAGADIVWGHHPHVSQPWESIHTRRGTKLIMYSTGNFISGQTWNVTPENGPGRRKGTGESALYRVDIEVSGTTTHVTLVRPLAFFNHRLDGKSMVVIPFDALDRMEMPSEWAVYYKKRHSDLANVLRDNSDWGFNP